jgi:hypothetical protein
VGRLNRNGDDDANQTVEDIWMEWDDTDTTSIGYWSFDSNEAGRIPFRLFHRDPTTGEMTRLLPCFTGGGHTPGIYDMADSAQVTDPNSGWPATDWCYGFTFAPFQSYDTFLADYRDNKKIDRNPQGSELFARMIIASPEDVLKLPANGTVIKFTTVKPIGFGGVADTVQVSTSGVAYSDARAKAELAAIRVVPNPYFAHSQYEMNQFERVVKFTRMPPLATVRIFNVAGDLVRTLEKDNTGSSFLEWNLLTDRQLPVASGVYIYHIEGKDAAGKSVGTVTGRVAVFIEKERLNTF